LTDPEFPAKFPPAEIQAGILAEDCENLSGAFLQKTSGLTDKKD
jgi:hypothetical protein